MDTIEHTFWTRPRTIPGLRLAIAPNAVVLDAFLWAVRGFGGGLGLLVVGKLAGVV